MQYINPLVNTINRNLSKSAMITYRLGSSEETILTKLIEVTPSTLSVVCTHPNPFLNSSILVTEYTKTGEVQVPKLVTTMMIPINNILGFKVL